MGLSQRVTMRHAATVSRAVQSILSFFQDKSMVSVISASNLPGFSASLTWTSTAPCLNSDDKCGIVLRQVPAFSLRMRICTACSSNTTAKSTTTANLSNPFFFQALGAPSMVGTTSPLGPSQRIMDINCAGEAAPPSSLASSAVTAVGAVACPLRGNRPQRSLQPGEVASNILLHKTLWCALVVVGERWRWPSCGSLSFLWPGLCCFYGLDAVMLLWFGFCVCLCLFLGHISSMCGI
jgi:hypothetical protein